MGMVGFGMRQVEKVFVRGVVLDLSVLQGKSAAAIAQRVGRRGVILPIAAFSDTIAASSSKLGTRDQRLRKMLAKLRSLVFDQKLPIRIPEWKNGKEIGIDPIHFLSIHSTELVRVANKGLTTVIRETESCAFQLEESQRERVSREVPMEENHARWLREWAVNGVDPSNGRLAKFIARCLVDSDCHTSPTPHERAISVIGCIDYFHKYGMRQDLPPSTAHNAVSNFFDWVYLIWALRFDAYLWTADRKLRSLCVVAKQVWRIAGLADTEGSRRV